MMSDLPETRTVVFELDRLAEYTDIAILDELRRVGAIEPSANLTTRLFQGHSKVSFSTVIRRFGSWESALMAADLSERWAGSLAAKMAASKNITDQEILDALVKLALRLGKTHLTWRDVDANLQFSGSVLKKRWGSVQAAFEAAGLASSGLGQRYTDEECFDNMLLVWTHHGRAPRIREMGQMPSKVGSRPYTDRFGTWNKALAAFVERVNSDIDIPSTDIAGDDARPPLAVSDEAQEKMRDRREISLGLRFKVLHRDRFKCVLCGDNPSTNPVCVLHVDHITPWSKGGRTSIENLRSLCEPCNIGRGNRYED